jgi:hypothetical protein
LTDLRCGTASSVEDPYDLISQQLREIGRVERIDRLSASLSRLGTSLGRFELASKQQLPLSCGPQLS